MNETIFALATAPGKAGIAVIRISGRGASAALADLAGSVPQPRYAAHVQLRDTRSGEAIDDGIALYFAAPHSFTGEDVVELQLHGSRAVIDAVFALLGGRENCRLAEPGEFTRRAFLNGKLDLTEAEAIGDLVAAETAAQRRQALRQLAGEFGHLCEAWRARLIRLQAKLEAAIDFPEEDLPPGLWESCQAEAGTLRGEIAALLADNHRGERLRDGLSVAILGPPNAGKSSLMNTLAKRDVAITSHIAGTTRDVIEVALDLGGYPVVLADTAGLRMAGDAIEEEGMRRARARAETADLRLIVVDASRPEEANAVKALVTQDAILIANKIDLAGAAGADWADRLGVGPASRLSVATGEGMAEFVKRLSDRVAGLMSGGATPLVTRARHRQALEACAAALGRLPMAGLPELAAEELRAAVRALGRITGRVDVEDMLDALFRDFCIGK